MYHQSYQLQIVISVDVETHGQFSLITIESDSNIDYNKRPFIIDKQKSDTIIGNYDIDRDIEQLFQIPRIEKYNAYTQEYMDRYMVGLWPVRCDDIVDPIKAVRENHKHIYKGDPSIDGFLYDSNNQPILRGVRVQFSSSDYFVDAMYQQLGGNDKVKDLELQDSMYDYDVQLLKFVYIPSPEEFRICYDTIKRDSLCGSRVAVVNLLKLEDLHVKV